jgi:hypothetical protein
VQEWGVPEGALVIENGNLQENGWQTTIGVWSSTDGVHISSWTRMRVPLWFKTVTASVVTNATLLGAELISTSFANKDRSYHAPPESRKARLN